MHLFLTEFEIANCEVNWRHLKMPRLAEPPKCCNFLRHLEQSFSQKLSAKLLYTTACLASALSTAPIMIGMAAALCEDGVASWWRSISKLPRLLVPGYRNQFYRVRSPCGERRSVSTTGQAQSAQSSDGSFAGDLFSEWGDVGQITAPSFSARSTALAIAKKDAGATCEIPLIVLAAFSGW